MDARSEPHADEATRLRRSVAGLAGIMALAAEWTSSDQPRIVLTLVEALLEMLELSFVSVRLHDPESATLRETVRIAGALEGTFGGSDLSRAIDASLGNGVRPWPGLARVFIGGLDVTVAFAGLGLHGEVGIVVAGSTRRDFPVDTERLLLEVAANQATTRLQQARLVTEQRRVTSELDAQVSRRTHELELVNTRLRQELEERRRHEEVMRAHDPFRAILDDLPAMVTLMTPDGEFLNGNRHMLDYFGAPLEELKRRPTTYSFHPDDRPNVDAQWKASVETGQPYDYEARLRRADGTYRWFHTRGFPLRDAEGRIVLWHLLQMDVDDRRRAEDALRASERNLKLTIDTTPALAWSTGPDGSADFFNQHYLEFVGLSPEQASGWGWTGAVHPEDLNGLAGTWQAIMTSGQLGEAEARLRRHDGEYRWFLFRANPLRDESGRIVKWYGVNTDIEDRKRAESELRRAYDSFADAQRLSHTGSFITDLVGDDHNWSEETYRIFEFDPATEVTVQRIRGTIHPDDLPPFDAMIARAMSGVDVNFYFRIVTAGGALKHVRGVAHVVEQVEGRPMFVGALQDVTEAVTAEEALNRARSDLAHVARLSTLNALTASIAHEVNQPLSGIMTNASTCLRMLDAAPRTWMARARPHGGRSATANVPRT